jgi:hypothetical protein
MHAAPRKANRSMTPEILKLCPKMSGLHEVVGC